MTVTAEGTRDGTATEIEFDPELQLIEAVRDTRTLSERFPLYKDAKISIISVDPNILYPTAKYALTPNLEFVSFMRTELITTDNIDVLKLNQVYSNSIYTVAPPVVEASDGVPAIVDGIHRCLLARREKEEITVVFVEGVDLDYPLISTPVRWADVIEYSMKPEAAHLLRDVRPGIQDESGSLRRFYRDFSYLGSAGRRPRQGQSS